MTRVTDAGVAPDQPTPRRRRRLPWFTEVLVALVGVALVQAFLVKPFGVPSQSMENTLHIGDRILVNRLDDTVERGDVVFPKSTKRERMTENFGIFDFALTPDEVATLALYLCSDEAGFVTGCDYPLDGGFIKLNT